MKETFNRILTDFNTYLFFSAVIYYAAISIGKLLGIKKVADNYEELAINGVKVIVIGFMSKELVTIIGGWAGFLPKF